VAKTSTRTDPERKGEAQLRRARLGRRVLLSVFAAFLAAGAAEVFGSKTANAVASGGGYDLEVTYPAVTRPGLPIRWEFTVRHPGGFAGPVQLATTFDYIHLFDISNLEPDVTTSTASATDLVYTFDPPLGDVLRVSLDGNTEPGIHELPMASTAVLVEGSPVVSVSYSTRVVP
jgi:hypothetical protein